MTARFEMRCDEAFAKRLDAWRRAQEDLPNRSETVRRLVEQGLRYEKALDLLGELAEGKSLDTVRRLYPEIFSDLSKLGR